MADPITTVSGSRPATSERAAGRTASSVWYRLTNSEVALALMCMGPATLLLLFILAFPVVQSLGLAFFKQDLLKPELGIEFVGLDNFAWLLDYNRFWVALGHSVLLTVVTVAAELVIAMVVALMLSEPFRGIAVVRGLFILPWAIPIIVAAFIWRGLLSPQYGLVNQAIGAGLSIVSGRPQAFTFDWFADPNFALLAIMVVSIWKGFPFVFLVLLAGLQALPQELSDAAKIDGANGRQEFRFVTLPQLRPVISIAVILRTITVFNAFDLVWLLTGGGPQDATLVLPVLVFNRAFVSYQVGRAAAITAVMCLILAAMTYFFLAQHRDEEKSR